MKAKPTLISPSQIRISLGLTKYILLAALRNRSGLFFSLVFPLAFVMIFGFLGNNSSNITIGIPDTFKEQQTPVYATLKELADADGGPVEIVRASQADLEDQLKHSKVDAILENAEGASVTLLDSTDSPPGASAADALVSGIVSRINLETANGKLQAAGISNQSITLETRVQTGKQFRYIDFILPGQIGFSLLSLATFGVAFSFVTLRKTLVLKRLMATPTKPITFVVAQCLSRSIQALIQTAIILAVGVAAFHFNLANGWTTFVEMLVLAFIGILSFVGFGILVAGIAKDEQSVPVALNLFNLPQMLLSGTFFPSDALPTWMQKIGNNLPLAYLNTALRKVANEGAHLTDVWQYILGLAVWALVLYILAARTFKTE